MLPATAFPVDVVARTAELRAEGKSWECVAKSLHCESVEELRYVIDRNEQEYARKLRRARREVLTDSFAEGVFTLRRLMRGKDEKTAMKAADAMIRFRATTIRHRKKLTPADAPADAPPAGPTPSDDTLRFVQFLEGQTNEQLHELVVACRRDEETTRQLCIKADAEERRAGSESDRRRPAARRPRRSMGRARRASRSPI